MKLYENDEILMHNLGKRPIYVDGKSILQGEKARLNNNSIIEISLIKLNFTRNETTKSMEHNRSTRGHTTPAGSNAAGSAGYAQMAEQKANTPQASQNASSVNQEGTTIAARIGQPATTEETNQIGKVPTTNSAISRRLLGNNFGLDDDNR
uniref:FHA domain-containing protein n=1 Tax=Ditylenchus dipsaci TaxID=166011 RepID=A0A915E6E3_9BILA